MTVRALIVIERPGVRHDAVCAAQIQGASRVCDARCATGPSHSDEGVAAARTRRASAKFVQTFLAFLAFIACASVHSLAQAREHAGTSPYDLSALHGEAAELARLAFEASHYLPNSDAKPVCELKALRPDNTEEDAVTYAPLARLTVRFTPIVPLASCGACFASAAWISQFWVTSALPRGPPRSRR